jgi:glycosyltransferase involved in cell wall biosynthesis
MMQRVLHVIDHTDSGGAQVVVLNLLRALKDSFSFEVAVLGQSGQFSPEYELLGIPVFTLGNGAGHWNPKPVTSLIHTIRRGRFDLVHTHLFKSNILGTVAAGWVGTNTILHDHIGVYPHTLKYHFPNTLSIHSYMYAYRYALSQCDRVLVLTPKDVRSYLDFYSLDSDKTTLLPNGVDLTMFSVSTERRGGNCLRQELGLGAESTLVIMVGRLDPVKDWMTFLRVSRQVQQQSDQSCGFLIVGSGPEEQRLREYVSVHKLKRVFFLGNRDDIPSLLQQADVFLLTSQRESFGIALLEAMAAGCPVVATRSGGPESILTDGINGLLTEVGDVQGLTNQVLRLFRDKSFRQRLAYSARQTVLNWYSLETVATRMAGVYREVLKQ